MLKSIYSILKSVSEQDEANLVSALRAADHPVIRKLLYYAFDPKVKFLLPEGAPPYKPCDFLDQEGRFYTEVRKMYLFIEGGNPNLTKLKREMLFIQLLESIGKGDAELLVAIKDKKLPFSNITEKVVREAFPGLLSEIEEN